MKVLATKVKDLSSISGPTWLKERTDSNRLSSDHLMQLWHACVHLHVVAITQSVRSAFLYVIAHFLVCLVESFLCRVVTVVATCLFSYF